jgi:hypothetical protein
MPMRCMKLSGLLMLLALVCSTSCKTTALVATTITSAVGGTGDVACDRRFVSGGEAAGFCQEVIRTVAVSAIRDDCLEKHRARALRGRCPHEKRIAGCKLSLLTDDGSEVYDWYYDVHDLERQKQMSFASHVESIEDVRRQCADARRYEEGAELVMP